MMLLERCGPKNQFGRKQSRTTSSFDRKVTARPTRPTLVQEDGGTWSLSQVVPANIDEVCHESDNVFFEDVEADANSRK